MSEIVDFLNRGGLPLWLIAALFFLLWFAVINQSIFFLTSSRSFAKKLSDLINRSHDKLTKDLMLMRAKKQFFAEENIIKTVVKTAPLLGLLGTVMGMIEVFETLSFYGTGDPKLMADGIAKATLPTMAGMVVAICGLFFITILKSIAEKNLELFKKELV